MKIIILYGDNTIESYNRLLSFIKEAKKRDWNIMRINNAKQNIFEALYYDSLFEKRKLVVIEDSAIFSPTVKKWIKTNFDKSDTTLVIYYPATLTKSFIKSLPKVDKVEEFKIPKLIWSFLESFYPGNSKNALLLFHETIKSEPIEFVFSLLAKLLRDLYWVKADSRSLPYPPWRVNKLKNQSRRFTAEMLKNLIFELADADIKSKTSDENLTGLVDFIIASKLE